MKPNYRVLEQGDNYEVTVLLPGVAKEDLEITAENGVVTIGGQRSWKRPVDWTPLYRETSDARFELTLTHDNSINVDNVKAELRDGVLRLTLAKSEALKPRKIAVN
ncbi:Hsp20/alpha crystallin family protein [Horticoccus luteus]|uniref:Hsp20/alpha crystallin family protein n=1 Tax=Horticoccus luteus TaxID=2862869 RepID=UPI0021020B49|nr:Hsp20/alpha crystallin family protein [Horticoccus luteus]